MLSFTIIKHPTFIFHSMVKNFMNVYCFSWQFVVVSLCIGTFDMWIQKVKRMIYCIIALITNKLMYRIFKTYLQIICFSCELWMKTLEALDVSIIILYTCFLMQAIIHFINGSKWTLWLNLINRQTKDHVKQ